MNWNVKRYGWILSHLDTQIVEYFFVWYLGCGLHNYAQVLNPSVIVFHMDQVKNITIKVITTVICNLLFVICFLLFAVCYFLFLKYVFCICVQSRANQNATVSQGGLWKGANAAFLFILCLWQKNWLCSIHWQMVTSRQGVSS